MRKTAALAFMAFMESAASARRGARAVAAAATLTACVVSSGPPTVGGYPTVYAEGVPPDVYAYPHVWYNGGYAYLVGDRWYYPHKDRWVVLQREPPELSRYRYTYRAAARPPAPPPAAARPGPPHYGYPR